MAEGAAKAGSLRDQIRADLDCERQRLHEEIRAYPTPIPRCDQQFNALIDRREQLFAELARLETAAAESTAEGETEALLAFIDSSACLDDGSRQRLKAALCQRSLESGPCASAAAAQTRSDDEPSPHVGQ